MNTYYIKETKSIIRKTGNKIFLLRNDFDYSKVKLLEITNLGKEIIEYLSTVKTENDIKQKFANSGINEQDVIKYVNFLSKKGYVKKWNFNKKGIRFSGQKFKNEWLMEKFPFAATIELSSHCNFSCVHCYLAKHREVQQELSLPQIKTILDKLHDIGILHLFLSGGEPMLRKDFVDIYIYAKKLGFLVGVFTNGSILTNEQLNAFREYPPLEIDISLYGADDETYKKVVGRDGAFDKVVNNIKTLIANGIFVSAKSPILTITKNSIKDMIKLTKDLHVPFRMSFDINPSIDNDDLSQYQVSSAEAAYLYKKYEKPFYKASVDTQKKFEKHQVHLERRRYACKSGERGCFVDYRGIVSPCIFTRHRGVNIFSNTTEKIWEQVRCVTYEKLAENDDYKCLHCKKANICNSCPAVRELSYGNPLIVKNEDCLYANELYKIMKEGGDLDERS